MAYKDNVQSLCDRYGLVNPIREEDLTISRLTFCSSKDPSKTHEVEATDMNRAGRLFVQFETDSPHTLSLESIRTKAAEFFTSELWDDCSLEKRALIFGIKMYDTVRITYK